MKKLVTTMLVSIALCAAAASATAATVVPNRSCDVQFVDGGPVYHGIGITVQTKNGYFMVVCRVHVPPPAATIVQTFPDTNGDVIIITRSGQVIVVLRSCGPSEAC